LGRYLGHTLGLKVIPTSDSHVPICAVIHTKMTGSESQILAYRTLKMKATEIILDLKTAQQAIASNWIEAYKKYVSPDPPSSRLPSPAAAKSPLNSDQVWVNTKSGKYWKPGSRYYAKTKQGEFMSEKEAVQKGYLPANGKGE
jgi:hypothetical protein